MINVGIVGGSGLTGKELIKILLRHKYVKINYITSRKYSGEKIENIFPELKNRINLKFISPDNTNIYKNIDVTFLCLPHTESMKYVGSFLKKGIKVIDLSADYRIKNINTYKNWYKTNHNDKKNIKQAIYGLPEIFEKEIKNANLIANPGCYATSILLGLIPFIKKYKNIIDLIIVDSKTGISGAGSNPTELNQFININENIIPYNWGRKHRHIGEVEDLIYNKYKTKIKIIFVPQIVSMDRGIFTNIYIKIKEWVDINKIKKIYNEFYKNKKFIRIVENISIHNVQNTNFCDILIDGMKEQNTYIIMSAIDNLLKGASAQAVQNMNILFNIEQTEGLL